MSTSTKNIGRKFLPLRFTESQLTTWSWACVEDVPEWAFRSWRLDFQVAKPLGGGWYELGDYQWGCQKSSHLVKVVDGLIAEEWKGVGDHAYFLFDGTPTCWAWEDAEEVNREHAAYEAETRAMLASLHG